MTKQTKLYSAIFSIGQYVVYPAHGVGQVINVETQQVAGITLEVFVVSFEHDKLLLRVPTARAQASGMRALASGRVVNDALRTLGGRARIKRTMWSRRAQEYGAKINSGSLVSIAEVVRDLHRIEGQPDQSYSERQIYESAMERMARELAAIQQIDHGEAIDVLSRSLAMKKAA